MLEAFKQETIVGYPRTAAELEAYCLARAPLDINTIFLPGRTMAYPFPSEPINGYYGLAQLDSITHAPVVFAGFDLTEDALTITHTPQPVSRTRLDAMDHRSLQRLRSREFRRAMVAQIVDLARRLKLKEVWGVPAALYPNVEAGITNYDYAYTRVDQVLKDSGFFLENNIYRLSNFPS